MPTEEEATVSTGDVTVTTEKAKEENHSVLVTITKDPKGLGLVIGLSKKSKNTEKKQVVFIRALQRRSNGSQSDAVKNGEMCPQDVVEEVNGVVVGTDLTVLTQEINKVEIDGDITFKLSRRAKDEKRRLKALADKKIARQLDVSLRQIFNAIDEDKSGKLTLAEIDKAGKQIFLDKLGLHLGKDVIENGFSSLEQFSEIGDGEIDYEQFRGVLYSKELALSGRKTRHAKYAVLFKKLDKDGSATIDKTEFLGANDLMKSLFGENSAAIIEDFEAADIDHDGKVSFEEFANAAEDFYERQMHPDGYEDIADEELHFTYEQSAAFIEEHVDEKAAPEEVNAALNVISTVVVSTASLSAEAVDPPEVDEAQAAAIKLAETHHEEMEAKKEEEAQKAHMIKLEAEKAQKIAEKKKKAEDKERKKQEDEAAAENAAQPAAAPAAAGCCVIA